jgi:hypothetical protein
MAVPVAPRLRMPRAAGRAVSLERALTLLAEGDLEVEGRLPWSSNATLLVRLSHGRLTAGAVYKPRRGERPLWDFPAGTLCRRETAAFVVSHALGWELVPPTVLRDGPEGPGAVQLFIPHDPELHYLAMPRPDPATIRRVVAFDILINNADRKSGHILAGPDRRLWAIDHGVSFHREPKLRTVIWEHAGEPIPMDILADLTALGGTLVDPASVLRRRLEELLLPAEIGALARRARGLVAAGCFPGEDPDRRAIPWPPV